MEGRGGREEREESRGSEQYSSGSPSKSSNPNGETGFLCGERGEKKGECMKGERERERERHGRQGESVKRERKEVVWVITPFPLFDSLPPSFLSLSARRACTCPSYCPTEMIYLCAGAGRHGKSAPHKGVVVPPWSFLWGLACAYVCLCLCVTRMSRSLPSQAPHPPEGSPNADTHSQMYLQKAKDVAT